MNFIRFIFNNFIGKYKTRKLLDVIFNFSNVKIDDYLNIENEKHLFNIINRLYGNVGIGYSSISQKNEMLFIKKILPKFLPDLDENVIFDVGSNKGDYLDLLVNSFPNSIFYGFEPNAKLFEILSSRFVKNSNVHLFQIAVGSEKNKLELGMSSNSDKSEFSTLVYGVLNDIHKEGDIVYETVDVEKIDEICIQENIQEINFIKIDTEGYELSVLLGSKFMLKIGKIKIIQFEFNSMNVFSKVFLRDFYELLSDYCIYRICSYGLKNLFYYNVRNEVFAYQNLIAIRKDLILNPGEDIHFD